MSVCVVPAAKSLVVRLMEVDKDLRITEQEAINHEWNKHNTPHTHPHHNHTRSHSQHKRPLAMNVTNTHTHTHTHTHIKQLQLIQNQFVFRTNSTEHNTPVLKSSQWLPVSYRIDF